VHLFLPSAGYSIDTSFQRSPVRLRLATLDLGANSGRRAG